MGMVKSIIPKSYKALVGFASSFFIGVPIAILFRHDFWDGTVIEYAYVAQDYEVIEQWLGISGLQVQILLTKFIFFVASTLSLSYHTTNIFFAILFLVFLSVEVMYICRKFLKMKGPSAVLAGLICGLFPSFSLLVSSVLTYYVFSLWIGWYSARKYAESENQKRYLYLIPLIVSLQYGVMLTICPIIVIFLCLLSEKKLYFSRFVLPLMFAEITFFVFQNTFNKPHGVMTGYNRLQLPKTIEDIITLVYHLKSFSSFLLIPIITCISSVIFVLVSKNPVLIKMNDHRLDFLKGWFCVFLLVFSVLPYLIVGKSTSLFWLDFWSGRHSFPLAPSIAITSAYLLEKSIAELSNIQRKFVFVISLILVGSLCLGLNLKNLSGKYFDYLERERIIEILKPLRYKIPDGILRIQILNMENYELDWVESNYLLFRVKGNLNTFTYVSSGVSPSEIPSQISDFPNKWFLFEKGSTRCITNITLTAIEEDQFIDKFIKGKNVKLKSIRSICPNPL